MIEPKIDDLLARVDSTLVILAARRARQINGYYSQLGEGIGEVFVPMVDAGPNRKALLGRPLQELVEALELGAPGRGRRVHWGRNGVSGPERTGGPGAQAGSGALQPPDAGAAGPGAARGDRRDRRPRRPS